MVNATCPTPRRQRPQIGPVRANGRFGALSQDLQALRRGTALLDLTELTTGEETRYGAQGVSENGVGAVVLQKFDDDALKDAPPPSPKGATR